MICSFCWLPFELLDLSCLCAFDTEALHPSERARSCGALVKPFEATHVHNGLEDARFF